MMQSTLLFMHEYVLCLHFNSDSPWLIHGHWWVIFLINYVRPVCVLNNKTMWWIAGFYSLRQEQMLRVCIQPIKRGNQIISHLCSLFRAVWQQVLPYTSWTFSCIDKCSCFSSPTFTLEKEWQQLSFIFGLIKFQSGFVSKALFPEISILHKENVSQVIILSWLFPVWEVLPLLPPIPHVCTIYT